MRITYDSEADALHIRLVEGIHQCRCLRLNDWVTLDIGPNESLVGIEVIDASEAMGEGAAPTVLLENVLARSA